MWQEQSGNNNKQYGDKKEAKKEKNEKAQAEETKEKDEIQKKKVTPHQNLVWC